VPANIFCESNKKTAYILNPIGKIKDMKRPRIIIADDHKLLLDAIKNLLEPEYEVVGTFSDGESVIDGTALLQPDIVILDISMPTMNGLNACAHLKKAQSKVKVIFMTMSYDKETIGEAFRNGASGYVLKTSAATELKSAIREVLRGGYFATPSLTEGMIGSFVQNFKKMKSPRDLTIRQKEVLQLLAEGYSMKQVARVLNITMRTVAFHKYTMMEHLGVTSSAELISYGIRHNIVSAQMAA
jgi:DNA-binding NarL/FixJ family response regulator